MRKFFSYLLLLSIVFQSTSQLWIITCFYIQREYITSNLCVNRFDAVSTCNGKCQLAKELKEDEKKQEQQLPDIKLKEVQLFVSNGFDFDSNPIFNPHSEKIPAMDENLIPSEFIFCVFHPPKQA